jgi:hypothetical protein
VKVGASRVGRPGLDWAGVDRLVDLAGSLAGAWGARARGSTSIGQERAILRLLGVGGLDRAGRPLAGEVADRFLTGAPGRLGGGIILPFAMALVEYDLTPQQLALDVASGAVDLALEAELLVQPDRRIAAEIEARRMIGTALDRIDANRTARHELLGMLGDAPRPWVGTTLLAGSLGEALAEGARHVRDGIDVVRVEVPGGRELRVLGESADEPPGDGRGARAVSLPSDGDENEPAPPGSQRALARLRSALDEAAAERRAYVRLETASPALAAPEQAVVAGFERIDLVEADVMAEIVNGRTDPDRALADHAFARRLYRRSGTQVVVGAGPLVVAPDLAAGRPSTPAARAGRALALQLLGVALALGDGLQASQVIVGALPSWLCEEREPAARAAAEVALREALFPGHPLLFEEPALPGQETLWQLILAGVLPSSTALVLRQPRGGSSGPTVTATRVAAAVAGDLAGARAGSALAGRAAEHAAETILAARGTLEALAEAGWRAVVGVGPSQGRRAGSAEAVAERSDPFDPLGDELPPP